MDLGFLRPCKLVKVYLGWLAIVVVVYVVKESIKKSMSLQQIHLLCQLFCTKKWTNSSFLFTMSWHASGMNMQPSAMPIPSILPTLSNTVGASVSILFICLTPQPLSPIIINTTKRIVIILFSICPPMRCNNSKHPSWNNDISGCQLLFLPARPPRHRQQDISLLSQSSNHIVFLKFS